MRRIVVTGMGAVSPLGCGVETNWSRLLAGRSGIRTLPEAITADLSAEVGGQVPDVAVDPEGGFDPDRVGPRKDQRKMDRFILFALLAADEAIAQADWKPEDVRSRQRTATVISVSGTLCDPWADLPRRTRCGHRDQEGFLTCSARTREFWGLFQRSRGKQ
jgi:3-oxoacyl-[acyl-carrier-protein] synthase II